MDLLDKWNIMELTSISQPRLCTTEQSAAFEAFRRVYPGYHDHQGLFNRIQQVVQKMQQHAEEIYQLDKIERRPDEIFYVTGKDVYIRQGDAGKGTRSSAFFVVQISLENGTTKNMLIKVARKPFKPEQEKLALLTPNSKISENIDHFKGAYKIQNKFGSYAALFEASSCDFNHIDYKKTSLPASFAMKQLLSVADGMASFHRANLVLRDIKGPNLLANWENLPGKAPEERPGKVTDFGLVMELPIAGTKHTTAGTPHYMAPYIWENILCQKYRFVQRTRLHEGGYQGKEADLFALGRTIQYDVIMRLLEQVAEKEHILTVKPLIQMFLKTTLYTEQFSDNELLAYEEANPGYVFHCGLNEGKDKLEVFRNEEEVYKKTLDAISLVERVLEEHEVGKLRDLAKLARDLQATTKEKLLTTLDVSDGNKKDDLIQAVITRLRGIEDSHPTRLGSLHFSPSPKVSHQGSPHPMETRLRKRKFEGHLDTKGSSKEDSQKTQLITPESH